MGLYVYLLPFLSYNMLKIVFLRDKYCVLPGYYRDKYTLPYKYIRYV